MNGHHSIINYNKMTRNKIAAHLAAVSLAFAMTAAPLAAMGQSAGRVSGEAPVTKADSMAVIAELKAQNPEGRPVVPAGIVAHRGYWQTDGSAQNSLTALRKAQALGVYSSETDSWLTADNHIVQNHDGKIGGTVLRNVPYRDVKRLRLPNGEPVPQLADMLRCVVESASPTILRIEIKEHDTPERTLQCASRVAEEVRRCGAEHKVEFTSFSLDACRRLRQLFPEATVYYLKGGMQPADVKKLGVNGLNYHIKEIRDNPQWVGEAHKLGMKMCVWTADNIHDMVEMCLRGVDLMSSNKPELAMQVRSVLLNCGSGK